MGHDTVLVSILVFEVLLRYGKFVPCVNKGCDMKSTFPSSLSAYTIWKLECFNLDTQGIP